MNKKDFLNELENALDGKLPESDIREITSDYADIFDSGVAEGKTEEETAAGIGSPAKIARTILEDGMDAGTGRGRGEGFSAAGGGREYTDFQRNINEKTSRIFGKVVEPDRNVDISRLAPMSRRLGAFVIDSILLGGVGLGGLIAMSAPFLYMVRSSSVELHSVTTRMSPMGDQMVYFGEPASRFAFANIVILLLLFGALNLFTTIILWATNGYTPGKWMLQMRVVKINGGKIRFLDALLRELVIKGIANSLLSGFLNLGSFIWGCATDDHKTVHDQVAQTRVIQKDRS